MIPTLVYADLERDEEERLKARKHIFGAKLEQRCDEVRSLLERVSRPFFLPLECSADPSRRHVSVRIGEDAVDSAWATAGTGEPPTSRHGPSAQWVDGLARQLVSLLSRPDLREMLPTETMRVEVEFSPCATAKFRAGELEWCGGHRPTMVSRETQLFAAQGTLVGGHELAAIANQVWRLAASYFGKTLMLDIRDQIREVQGQLRDIWEFLVEHELSQIHGSFQYLETIASTIGSERYIEADREGWMPRLEAIVHESYQIRLHVMKRLGRATTMAEVDNLSARAIDLIALRIYSAVIMGHLGKEGRLEELLRPAGKELDETQRRSLEVLEGVKKLSRETR